MQVIAKEVKEKLINSARIGASRAYAPYSKFRVGAAILSEAGSIYIGCNVENASYGGTTCAERTAVFGKIAAGDNSKVVAVVVYTPTELATPPCGFFRQVLNEFGPEARVLCVCDSDHTIESFISELLPGAFGPHNLA